MNSSSTGRRSSLAALWRTFSRASESATVIGSISRSPAGGSHVAARGVPARLRPRPGTDRQPAAPGRGGGRGRRGPGRSDRRSPTVDRRAAGHRRHRRRRRVRVGAVAVPARGCARRRRAPRPARGFGRLAGGVRPGSRARRLPAHRGGVAGRPPHRGGQRAAARRSGGRGDRRARRGGRERPLGRVGRHRGAERVTHDACRCRSVGRWPRPVARPREHRRAPVARPRRHRRSGEPTRATRRPASRRRAQRPLLGPR